MTPPYPVVELEEGVGEQLVLFSQEPIAALLLQLSSLLALRDKCLHLRVQAPHILLRVKEEREEGEI